MISVRDSAGEVAMQAVDGEVDHGGANGGAARGEANSARKMAGAGWDQVVGQGEEVGRL
jgi:hypothetical protein